MGKINLLIANSSEAFTDEDISTIEKASSAANEFISKNFEFNYDVDVVITAPSYLINTIPEDGITGRTYTSRLIIIVINKKQSEITEDAIFETICHEMSHSIRWEYVPEYANTLFEGMILEGLAIALEEKAMTDTKRSSKQFFLKTIIETPPEIMKSLVSSLQKDFNKADYDYETIFYTGNRSLPRWAGYRLGYYFVINYLKQNNKSIEAATLASYKKFKQKNSR